MAADWWPCASLHTKLELSVQFDVSGARGKRLFIDKADLRNEQDVLEISVICMLLYQRCDNIVLTVPRPPCKPFVRATTLSSHLGSPLYKSPSFQQKHAPPSTKQSRQRQWCCS